MRPALALALVLTCAACSQEKAPANEVVKVAEKVVAPGAQPSPLAKGKWAPADTCDKVAGAGAFRRQLEAAIEARDPDVLAALAAEDVKLDFGGGAGRAELRKRLSDQSTGLWQELEALLALGCSANGQGGITIPWYFDQEMGKVDPFETWLVTGENVPVLAGPGADSERVGRISWDLVTLAHLDPEQPRQQIELPDGTSGYIATDKLRSLIDYRLIASSRNGRWRITSFLAGD